MRLLKSSAAMLAISWSAVVAPAAQPPEQPRGRVRDGLVALWDFTVDELGVVHEVSGMDPPIHLQRWVEEQGDQAALGTGLRLMPAPLVLRTIAPPVRLNSALRESGEFTLEAWLQPASLNQAGPARIISLSRSTDMRDRNLTLGQAGDRYSVRLRLSAADETEVVEVAGPSGTVRTDRHQVVVTYSRCPHCGVGALRIYINGERVLQDMDVEGDLSGWDDEMPLLVGNEATLDRQWYGTLYLAAIYRRALSPEEVTANYRAGPDKT